MPSHRIQKSVSQNNHPTTAVGVTYPRKSASSLSMRGSNQELGHLSVNAEKVKRFRSDFPSLPGFSRFTNLRPQSPKNQSLTFQNGYMMVNSPVQRHDLSLGDSPLLQFGRPTTVPSMDPPFVLSKEVNTPNDVSGRYSLLRQKRDRENNQIALPFCPESRLPSFLEHDRRVLLFNVYYEETVLQSATEDKRIMKCKIFFYVEDGTIEIIQTKQDNSGIPQGVFLTRKRVQKIFGGGRGAAVDTDDVDTEYYEIDDFKIGNDVEIYSRIFHIVDCNESTKNYVMEHHGWNQGDVAPLSFPRDSFAEGNKAKMQKESGVPGVDRKRKMHDLKEVMESMLGKQVSTTDRGAFLTFGQEALCFHIIWDDRERLYGDIQYYRLFYYLADDNIEIQPILKKNDGKYAFPKLLKRMKLPKPGDGSEYYSWKDLCIGKVIDIFGRSMQLATCDLSTRAHYKSHGIMLKSDMPLEPEIEKIKCVRQIPPYNGFGSEEDSLRSCTGGINPPPAKRDITVVREKMGVILRFNARLLSDETNRRFVIQYFMENDTMSIQEPPIQNSGIMGGKFLSRGVVKKNDGDIYLATDMYTGNVLDIMCHQFELLNADEYSYRLMENDSKTFLLSSYANVIAKIESRKDDICKYFATEYSGENKISFDDLSTCSERVVLSLNKQEILTLWRKLDKRRKGKVSFTKLIKLLESESHQNAV